MRAKIKNFGKSKSNKSINNFDVKLDKKSMLFVKGGEDDPDKDLWPPIAGTGTTGSTTTNSGT